LRKTFGTFCTKRGLITVHPRATLRRPFPSTGKGGGDASVFKQYGNIFEENIQYPNKKNLHHTDKFGQNTRMHGRTAD
jgi:hypothetical protein